MIAICLPHFPVAGLDPATHVFLDPGRLQDVDARVKPGQGDFKGGAAR
jgi:hypothetical protein